MANGIFLFLLGRAADRKRKLHRVGQKESKSFIYRPERLRDRRMIFSACGVFGRRRRRRFRTDRPEIFCHVNAIDRHWHPLYTWTDYKAPHKDGERRQAWPGLLNLFTFIRVGCFVVARTPSRMAAGHRRRLCDNCRRRVIWSPEPTEDTHTVF